MCKYVRNETYDKVHTGPKRGHPQAFSTGRIIAFNSLTIPCFNEPGLKKTSPYLLLSDKTEN